MITKSRISIQSCLFAVCFVIFTLTILETVYAGGKAQCPCFNSDEIEAYAPKEEASTNHMFIEDTEELNDQYQIYRIMYYDENDCSPECPNPSFVFGAGVGENGIASCVGFAEDGGFNRNEENISIKEYQACVELLKRAEERDRLLVLESQDE